MSRLDARLRVIEARWPELSSNLYDSAIFEETPHEEAVRWFSYFFSLPKIEGKRPSLRSHILALYDPFAKRSIFPAGIRFSCNTYVGCMLQCAYCYIQTYFEDPLIVPYSKQRFSERLEKDFREMETLDLPVAPLHFSNSTDALQEKLESQHQNTLYLLRRLAEGEHRRFNPIRMLTRNPARLLKPEYLDSIKGIKEKLTVQISIPLLDPEAGRQYEPNVPSAAERLRAMYRLRGEGIAVSMRIDPLYPRDPLPPDLFGTVSLGDFNLVTPQREQDLRYLVQAASSAGCSSIITSALKIPKQLSQRNQRVMKSWIEFYRSFEDRFPRLNSRNFHRLPLSYQHGELIRPLVEESANRQIKIEHCKSNLIEAKA